MGVTWTEEQQKVISLRDRNILVSAAAGSGKTAVLVQRILSKIMDTERPVDKLTSLAGKKLHGKRNHIARFKDDEDWSYEPMTAENKQECYDMNLKWCDRRACKWNEDMSDEQCALNQAMKYFDELHLEGGILRKAGEIVAFTIGERLNSDTYVVHFEKAFPEIQGAYPMINQQFVMHNCQEYSYVNREDDAGDEGLRKAKLSYYPDILLKNYTAREI